MSESEVKRLINTYKKQKNLKEIDSIQNLMESLNIDPFFENEINSWLKQPKHPKIVTKPVSENKEEEPDSV
jgi:alpha-mannosidase